MEVDVECTSSETIHTSTDWSDFRVFLEERWANFFSLRQRYFFASLSYLVSLFGTRVAVSNLLEKMNSRFDY
jgi:hypothetical protein